MSLVHDVFLLECKSYEEYLDSFIKRQDLQYQRSIRSCRQIVEFGYRSPTKVYTPDEFEKHKVNVVEAMYPTKRAAVLFCNNLTSTDPVVRELAYRERLNVQRTISTIIFMTYRLPSGFYLSGYIDFERSLSLCNTQHPGSTDWAAVFTDRAKFHPKKSDLSFYDWHNGVVYYNNSRNYIVQHDVKRGLTFMHRGDQKMICVDASKFSNIQNCTRSSFFSPIYGHVVLYDHVVHKKS